MGEDKRAVLLVAHGSPARDLPRALLQEMRQIHGKADKSPSDVRRARELDDQVRHWPRTAWSDPYREGTEALVRELQTVLGDTPVSAAYNEFCAPSIEEAVARLVGAGFSRVDVFSTMMTPGGGHSERDIPAALKRCRERFPSLELHYRWPYDLSLVARVIKEQL